MSNGLVKLIALTGAIGVGLLVVLQVQKGLTKPRFSISQEVEPEAEPSSPSLTNLGDALLSTPAPTEAATSTGPVASSRSETPDLLTGLGDLLPPDSAPKRTLPVIARSEPAAPPSQSAPSLSFKDDTDLSDPFGYAAPADSEPSTASAIAPAPALLAPATTTAPAATIAADGAENISNSAPSGLRLVAGDESDLVDPFAEEVPPLRKPTPARLSPQIPNRSAPHAPQLVAPGRASLIDDEEGIEPVDELESDPFGTAPPPLRGSTQPAQPVPLPDDDATAPLQIQPAAKPDRTIPSDDIGTDSQPVPTKQAEPDPFGIEEVPPVKVPSATGPAAADDNPWPALGTPSGAAPTLPAESEAELNSPSSAPIQTPPDPLPLRRAPAPTLELLPEEEPSPLRRGERAAQDIEIPDHSRVLPALDLPDKQQPAHRREPLHLTGEREPDPSGDFDGDGTAREGVPRGEQQPRLTIRKLAPPQATLGQPLIYEVLIENVGDVPAHQVVVEDRIPRGTRLTGTIPRAEMLDKRLFWKLGTVEPGSNRKISIRVIPEEEGPIGSVAKVNFVAEIAAEIVVTAPQLSLKIECPAQARNGDDVEMKFVIRNSGNGDAKNVVLRDILPKGLQHPAGVDLENAIGDLKAGESRELTLQLTAADSGHVENRVVLTADGGLKVEETAQLEIVGEQLKLTRKGQSKVYVGRAAVYAYNVTNEGKQSVKQAMVIEQLPAGFDFVEASEGGRFDPNTRTVSWTLGEVGPGESREVSARYSARTTGEYSSHVQLTGASGSIASIQGQVSVAGMPALSIDSPGEGRVVAIGERLVSKILVQNRGTASAENVELIVNLPPELKLVDARGPVQFRREGRAIIFDAVPVVGSRSKAAYELTLEAVSEGDSRLELEIAADHLSRPVHREEVVQVVTGDSLPLR